MYGHLISSKYHGGYVSLVWMDYACWKERLYVHRAQASIGHCAHVTKCIRFTFDLANNLAN